MVNKRVYIITLLVTAVFGAAALFYGYQTNEVTKALNNTKDELKTVQVELKESSKEIKTLNADLKEANKTIDDLKNSGYKLVYMGNFKLTHYCTEKQSHICGIGTGKTYTGTTVTAGRTIAVDPRVIPLGSQVYIEGYGWRTAEDTGGAVDGNHIDIAVGTHKEATKLGTTTGDVWVLIKK